jgi:hypothetical protein
MTTDELIARYEKLADIAHEALQLQNKIIADLQQKLLDATESYRRPKCHGYVFDVYHQEDVAFIRSYLNRKREERSYEFT